MSVTSQVAKSGPFLISSLPQITPVGFPFQSASDLILYDSGPVGTPNDPAHILVLGSDYTVSGGGYDTSNNMQVGSVTLLAGGTNNIQVNDYFSIARNVPINQTTSLLSTGPLTAEIIEQALDKQATISQQLNGALGECLKFEPQETISGVLPIASRSNKYLAFDSNGAPTYLSNTTAGPTDASFSVVTATGSTTSRALNARFAERLTIRDFGAVGDGVTNDSTNIQAAIDYVYGQGGGNLFVPPGNYKCNVVIKQGVRLIGYHGSFGYLPSAISSIRFTANIAGAVVDTPVGSIQGPSITGIDFEGLGAGTACIGIQFRNVSWGLVRDCHFNNFSDQAIIHTSGVACEFSHNLALNCLLNRTRAGNDGVFYVTATDDFFNDNEVTASVSTNKTAGGQCNAYYVGGANHFFVSCIGETSDSGFCCASNSTRYVNCRADLNMMHGYFCPVGAQFSNCIALSNSQDTDNTYSGWYFSAATAQGATMSGCISNSLTTKKQKYGFEDYASYSAVGSRNVYDASCRAYNYGTAAFLIDTFLGSGVVTPPVLIRPSATGSITVDVTGTSIALLSQVGAATITNFTGGTSGQTIKLLGNVNVTIANNATINTNTGADKILAASKVYTFTLFGSTWVENA